MRNFVNRKDQIVPLQFHSTKRKCSELEKTIENDKQEVNEL